MARKRIEVKNINSRIDVYCKSCDEVTSLYITDKSKSKLRTPHCGYCGESIDTEKYNSNKHGGITGHTPWTTHEVNMLKELMNQKLTWEEIHQRMGDKRCLRALQRYAERHGWTKRYKLTTNQRGAFYWRVNA